MKKIHFIFFIVLASLIYSCKNNATSNKKKITFKSIDHNQDTLIIDENYLENTRNLLRDLPFNEYHNESYNKVYSEKKYSISVELLYKMPTEEKYISYSMRETENLNNIINYVMIYDKNKDLALTVITPYFKELINNGYNIKEGRKDTVFFKNNKIYFWKNKEATIEELLIKEKEILLVKREVDSLLKD